MKADSEYVVRIVGQVRQQLLELPHDERLAVIQCLQTELTGTFDDQTTEVKAWNLTGPGPYWVKILTCGMLAVHRLMTQVEVSAWEAQNNQTLGAPGYMVVYLVVDVDASGAQ